MKKEHTIAAMKVLQINTVYGEGSTGSIAKAIHDLCLEQKIQCVSAHRCVKKGQQPLLDSISISSKWDSRIHGQFARFTMLKGMGSAFKTWRFLQKVKEYAPDVIHLHNLHGSYVNLPLLFDYIKKHRIPVVLTLHDCWNFTAICSHFAIAGCDRWKAGCHNCPQKKRFSASVFDITGPVWRMKRAWFSNLPKAAVVAPSHWVEELAKASFLGQYPVKTIYNGIDLDVFCETYSDFREKYGLFNKRIVLGVAFDWSYEKGLDVFFSLSQRLGEEYQIVLVGTNDEIDRKLPKNIISIHRTANRQELAQIYTAADVFVNPTREEVLGLVNLEALACGTPVVTFATGGSPECVDEGSGVVVAQNDVDAMEREIIRICTQQPYLKENCRKQAQRFDKQRWLKEYLRLYQHMGSQPMEELDKTL